MVGKQVNDMAVRGALFLVQVRRDAAIARQSRGKGSERGGDGARSSPTSSCAICLLPLVEEGDAGGDDDDVSALRCGHQYHAECIGWWRSKCLTRRIDPSCPMCRAPIAFSAVASGSGAGGGGDGRRSASSGS